jgi:voltage-gated potassium channel
MPSQLEAVPTTSMHSPGTPERQSSAPYELFILGLSFYSLAALATETFFPLSPDTRLILRYSDTVICGIFLMDFARNVIRAPNKLGYLKWGWIDLISSIPAVDAFRVGRAARIIRILRVLRGFRSLKRLTSYLLQRRAQAAFATASLVAILLVIFSSMAILEFEAGVSSSNIKSAQDALWWAYTTLATAGYGDVYPVSTEGRILAAVLVTAGVGLFGTFTGFVATWFLAPTEATEPNAG